MTSTNVNVNSSGQVQLGNGAQFWVYLSPQNDTSPNDLYMAGNLLTRKLE